MPILLSTTGIIGTASTVNTGTGGSIAIAALAALAMAMGYMFYSQTQTFDRRFAFANVRRHQLNKDRLNFARLIR